MSNFNEDFDEEDEEEHLPNTILSSNGISMLGAGGNNSLSNPMMSKKKRSHPGNPDPNAEVIALSPRTLMATNRYVCEVCHKGFQRDQNLQLHRRGHNLPWKLKQKPTTEVRKRVYVCPEPSCVHHDSSRALGDLTGIKKHFSRKHGEKKWKCEKCSKRYAVQSDWKAHSKICGTREYRCDCGTIFSRKDSFVTHRAFCDALATENYKVNQTPVPMGGMLQGHQDQELLSSSFHANSTCSNTHTMVNLAASNQNANDPMRSLSLGSPGMTFSSCSDDIFNPNASRASSFGVNYLNGLNNGHTPAGSPYMSATALLQKAAEMGSKLSDSSISPILLRRFMGYSSSALSSNESIHEAPSTVNQATTTGLYVANQNFFSKNLEGSINMASRPDSAVIHGGFVDSPLIVHSEIGEAANSMEGVFTGGSEKMTVDFLGVGPAGNLSLEEGRSCDVDAMGLTYSERQRDVHSEWFAHHS